MSRAAWVSKWQETDYEDGWQDFRSTETAWVFPHGLAVGKQVNYFRKEHKEAGSVLGGGTHRSDKKIFAVGKVADVKGNIVSFSWYSAVSQLSQSGRPDAHQRALTQPGEGPWKRCSPPFGSLQTSPSRRTSDARATRTTLADRCDEYRIEGAKEAAWAMLRLQKEFWVKLVICSFAEDGQLRAKVAVPSAPGKEMEFHLPERSTVQALALLVAKECQLGPATAVKVEGPKGGLLDPGSELQGTSRTAWVSKDKFSEYEDGVWEADEAETAWVFPDGLAVGKQVHYFRKRLDQIQCHIGRDQNLHSTQTNTLAIGHVAEVDGKAVSISWAGAISREDEEEWTKSRHPWESSLQTDATDTYRTTWLQCDEYQIEVPEGAWALLPRPAFLVTLMTRDVAEDGQLRVKVATVGGDEMEFRLPEGSTVEALALLVAKERQLGPAMAVKVVGPELAVLDPDYSLC